MEDNPKDIELRTFAEPPSATEVNEVLQDSALCFENRDYLSMDNRTAYVNTCSTLSGNGYEEMKYENTILPPPLPYDDVRSRTDSGVYENCPSGIQNENTADKPINIIKRLRIGKSSYRFWKYSIFAVNVIYTEVESLIFLEIFYILAGLLLIGFGVRYFRHCPMSASLAYLVFCYGGCAIVSSGTNINMKCRKQPSIYHVFESISYRSMRLLMIVCCILGLVEVYVRFPPEEYDTESTNYCSPLLYWSVVYIFTLTASVVAVIILHIIIAILWYFM